MDLILLLQSAQDVTLNDAKSILWYNVVALIGAIGAVFGYFKMESSALKTELKDERAYNRGQDAKNIETILSVNIALTQFVKQLDRNADNLSNIKEFTNAIKPIIEANAVRLEEINKRLDK